MVAEKLCIFIVRAMRGTKVNHGWNDQIQVAEDSISETHLHRELLGHFDLATIDAAIRWLFVTDHITRNRIGISEMNWFTLTDKGRKAADDGVFADEDKKRLYREQNPYEVFIAHQFNADDRDLVTFIRERVLQPIGLTAVDGRADGLEDFRSAILSKIKRARYFLCLLTRRGELTSGDYASSVWLYQETGVAVAYGKKPLLLVEDGIGSDYVGELVSIYEHIRFTRSNHPAMFDGIARRFLADLDANQIPRPPRMPL